MATFANGGDGRRVYRERYCQRCVHYKRDGLECHVIAVHILYSYDSHTDTPGRKILDILIPMDRHNNPGPCRMFIPSLAAEAAKGE